MKEYVISTNRIAFASGVRRAGGGIVAALSVRLCALAASKAELYAERMRVMRFHKLDLNLLSVLDALFDHQSVSRAAEQLNLTQPTISNALSRLREHYGDELLVISGRRMVPTPLAESLRQPVAEVLRTLRDIVVTRAGFDPATDDGTFVVACSDYMAEVLLAEVGRRMAVLAPNVTLSLTMISTRTLDELSRGNIDLVVMPDIVSEPCLTDLPLCTDHFVPLVWQGNTRFTDSITFDHYLSANHIIAEVGDAGGVDAISGFFSNAGHAPRMSLRVPNFSLAAKFAVGTLHVATLPFAMARVKIQELPLRVLRPEFDLPPLNEMLRWPRRLDGDPANAWLRGLISAVARETFGDLNGAGKPAASDRRQRCQ